MPPLVPSGSDYQTTPNSERQAIPVKPIDKKISRLLRVRSLGISAGMKHPCLGLAKPLEAPRAIGSQFHRSFSLDKLQIILYYFCRKVGFSAIRHEILKDTPERKGADYASG